MCLLYFWERGMREILGEKEETTQPTEHEIRFALVGTLIMAL